MKHSAAERRTIDLNLQDQLQRQGRLQINHQVRYGKPKGLVAKVLVIVTIGLY